MGASAKSLGYPALATDGLRQIVNKPITVDVKWIPPHTVIVAPRWSISQLETPYEKPAEFIPERWTTKPDMVKNDHAFSPFAKGMLETYIALMTRGMKGFQR
ncbi:hypothetical protein GGS26DRAFT_588344 [Hypomontagnella submonticulosa]|nr:hypothetical protein GGS26DRAFT_588344 [Hypomontagnella submonticulosa]